MKKPLITIAGETREMNAEEYAQYLIDQEEGKKAIKSFEEKEAKKQALLEKLGITEDEAKLLLS